MKKNLLAVIALVLINLSSQAQIEVNGTGQVGIRDYNIRSGYDLTVNDFYVADMYASDLDAYSIYASGGLSVGSSSTYGYKFRVANGQSSFLGEVFINGQIVQTSDERLKKNKEIIEYSQIISKIKKINGWNYEFKDPKDLRQMHNEGQVKFSTDTIHNNGKDSIKMDIPNFAKGRQYGLMAQEVKKEFPELVVLDSVTMVYGIDYMGFIPILLSTIKSQEERIEDLELRLSALEKKVMRNQH
jgi:hypothetical protein